MKTRFPIILIIATIFLFSTIVLNAQIAAIGAENGWGLWKASTGNFSGGVVNITTTVTPTAPRFNLTSGSGTDACTPGPITGSPTIPVVASGFGNASIQLGQVQNASGCAGGGCVERLTTTFVVTPQDTALIFSYAIVVEDPGHVPSDAPFVSFLITDILGDTIPCGYFRYTGGPSEPSFYKGSCSTSVSYYKPWTINGVKLTNYIGQQLKLEITNSDCGLGGHFAHSYWDFSGNIKPQCCLGQSLTMCASADTTLPYSYTWFHNNNPTNLTTSCITITPQQGDTFGVYVNLPSGCEYYQAFVPQDTCLSGINNNETLQSLTILPNPSTGKFTIAWSETIYRADIYNLFGEKIYSSDIGRQQSVVGFDISFQPDGVYFLRLNTSEGIVTQKVVLQRQ